MLWRKAMPELPEVETVVRTLRPRLVGRTITSVWSSGLPLRMRHAVDIKALRACCRAADVTGVSRRAKYILIELGRQGRKAGTLLVHLGMTGRLRVEDASDLRVKHMHVAWTLADGHELRFVDPRRFGFVMAAEDDVFPELRCLGPDAWEGLVVDQLGGSLEKSKAPIKAFLLDQRRLAGLGNIYACEALFRAGIHPRTKACAAHNKAGKLASAIHATLELGIANCGTSFRDFVDADGTPGRNIDSLLVYGREGEPCKACTRPIRRAVDAGRSTFFCPYCQKR
jgi:formamidopyrimidine-DNA glycosylase